jgi:hypothetical protein
MTWVVTATKIEFCLRYYAGSCSLQKTMRRIFLKSLRPARNQKLHLSQV